MSTDEPLFGRELLQAAFCRLDQLLSSRSLTADVFVFGGAAVVLGFEGRPKTRDVDAIWKPHGAVLEAAWQVASELNLPNWRLNEQAAMYLPSGHRPEGATSYSGTALRVTCASAELLLAMKVRAARSADRDDIVRLANHLNLTAAVDIIQLSGRVFGDEVPERQKQVIEDLFPA